MKGLLPMTLLAFLRPVPLPYSWAAPPEPLSAPHARLALLLTAALGIYHLACVAAARGPRARRKSTTSFAPSPLGPAPQKRPSDELFGAALQL